MGLAIAAARGGSDDIFERARAAVDEAGSYRFSVDQRFGADDQEQSALPFRMSGEVDTQAGVSRLQLEISTPGMETVCTYLTSQDAQRMLVSVHETRRAEFGGAAWVRTQTAPLMSTANLQLRPDRFYEEGRLLFGDLEDTGTADVRGVTTTRYRGEADLSALAPGIDASPLPGQPDLRVPVDIYVGEDDLVRRVEFQVQGQQPGGFSFVTTMDLYDYGSPVDIALPPDEEITEGAQGPAASACFPAR